ncbi:MAG: porin [Pirellula sp.]|nr:porin [Pirellula sp.]
MKALNRLLVGSAILVAAVGSVHGQEDLDLSPSDMLNQNPEPLAATSEPSIGEIYSRLEALEAANHRRNAPPPAFSLGSEPWPYTAGGGSKATGGDPTVLRRPQEGKTSHSGKLPFKSSYDHEHGGLRFSSDDGEYSFGVNVFSQIDAKIYPEPSPGFATSGFYNPRSRFYLQGNVTKPIQYTCSFQNTYDSLGLTDAYLNFNYDSRCQIRVGRFKTPFTYEFYRIHVWDLPTPERSLFANNYEANRRLGLMLWGVVLDNRFEYAVGTFNTQRNSFEPNDNNQDAMAFLNFKPFYNLEEGALLRDWQFGGSVDAGQENQSVLPAALRTNSPPSSATVSGSASDEATVPFLQFNSGVRENGNRALWELHTAYYYRRLAMLAAWEWGHESYALGAGPSTRIPIDGWFFQGGYILTGENIRDRTLVDPHRPFNPRAGCFGLGALEATARYSALNLDSRVFTAGLADPTRWSNGAQLVDVGMNWYLNKFVKVYVGWERAVFDSPVFSNTGALQSSSDMFWTRTQLYF